jgi:hypothetical protein
MRVITMKAAMMRATERNLLTKADIPPRIMKEKGIVRRKKIYGRTRGRIIRNGTRRVIKSELEAAGPGLEKHRVKARVYASIRREVRAEDRDLERLPVKAREKVKRLRRRRAAASAEAAASKAAAGDKREYR